MSVLLVAADARHIPLADESVQCCVTSPPYWGLRKYAGEQELVWGDVNGCAHDWGESIAVNATNHTGTARWNHTRNGRDEEQPPEKRVAWLRTQVIQGFFCQTCGAWRGGYGLEPTVEMYVAHTVEILREIRRVLRTDGVLFWNIGDSYATGAGRAFSPGGGAQGEHFKAMGAQVPDSKNPGAGVPVYQPNRMPQVGLKPKDLCLIPERVALAAQADGWWVRSRILWCKPNPMPESVRDRPTDAAEHIWMFTKSERYYWDADAVKEPSVCPNRPDLDGESYNSFDRRIPVTSGDRTSDGYRNLRNVWTFATQPYKGAHFATFPEELPRRCILAGSKPGDLILDPFGGSGSTGRVAIELQRRAVLLDIAYSHEYGPLAKKRTSNVQLEAIFT